jgi:peptidoglycan/xylan/chitin deacetylase (PgdA/CDA1 family)
MTLTSRIGRSIRWLKHRFSPGALILVYHHVVDSSDPGESRMSVTPEALSMHLALLRQHANPMSLAHLVRMLRSGQVPQRAVAVTFDDGCADNLFYAAPLLERHEVPATVFVTTGLLGKNREFWWDELRRLLTGPGTLPERLSLSINGRAYEWKLASNPSDGNDGFRRQWLFGKKSGIRPTPREEVFRCIHKLLKGSLEEEHQRVLETLSKWADARVTPRPTHRPMTAEEVVQLAEGRLIDIGAHTVTHPILSTLSTPMQRKEIQGSKTRLEEILGRPVTSFAYPYGSRRDYSSETVTLVREAGFDCACSNFRDVIFSGVDCYQLPRIPVRCWNETEFASRLGLHI